MTEYSIRKMKHFLKDTDFRSGSLVVLELKKQMEKLTKKIVKRAAFYTKLRKATTMNPEDIIFAFDDIIKKEVKL